MSDGENSEERHLFYADRAKSGRAGCKKCKQKINSGELRMAKAAANPFGSGLMKMWHHVDCMFQVFAKQRASTAKIESVDDVGGWDSLSKEDQEEILSRLPDSVRESAKNRTPAPVKGTASKGKKKQSKASTSKEEEEDAADNGGDDQLKKAPQKDHKDNSLREFRRLCADISNKPGYLDKTAIVRSFITEGSGKDTYKGDLLLLIRLLLPGVIKRVYNLQSKQIIKLFSRLFGTDQEEMLEHLEQGDVAETIRVYFELSTKLRPANKSLLTIHDVDHFLEYLSKLTREEDQMNHFASIASKCTANDLKIIIRLIKHDLRINAGAKHILDAVHEDAYEAFQASRDIKAIINKFTSSDGSPSKTGSNNSIGLSVLVPVLPMLAQPCKSSDEAIKKCPNGMYSEIKYDGERVQVHKQGKTFKYYSRSLKPVMPHKVKHLEEFIPKAFPHGKDLILDSEILMIDTDTGKPLPFGSLGIHKKNEYKNANVCLFVFDCMYYNGESLLNRSLKERKDILTENMKEIPFRIVFSEMKFINTKKDLEAMMTDVFKQGLEGLVLKDTMSIYEPGKRHWLKVKKDYLFGGAMADSADLVVLGAWYGTGQKGGMMSVFLMGCYDEKYDKWCTVTKVHTGHDDKTLERLQTELEMEKISKDPSKVPKWLKCHKNMIPDFIAKDPKKQPVWEIAGAELTKNVVHTSDGISIRFPRVTRIRDDKDWKSATDLNQLKEIYRKSKETADFALNVDQAETSSASLSSPEKTSPKKRAASSPCSPGPSKKAKYKLKNPLPDLFVGMKITLPTFISKSESETLERYFVAYGGEILDGKKKSKGTHRIIKADEVDKSDSKCLTMEQIWKCIKEQRSVA